MVNVTETINDIKTGYESLKNSYFKCAKQRDICLNFIKKVSEEFNKSQNLSLKRYLELVEQFEKDYKDSEK